MEKVCIGRIINTFGLKGEVKIESYSDFDEQRYQKGNLIYIEKDQKELPLKVSHFRMHKGFPLVAFRDYEDINLIEAYKGCFLYVDKDSRPPLAENEYYQTDLLDLDVYDEEGKRWGKVSAVEPTSGAQNNLRIQQDDGTTFLIPYIPEFIRRVDLNAKKICIHMERGLL